MVLAGGFWRGHMQCHVKNGKVINHPVIMKKTWNAGPARAECSQ